MVRQTFDHFRHVALQWPTSPMQTSTITNPSPLASITSGYRDSGQGREDQVQEQQLILIFQAQQLIIISPSPCSLLARSEAPISLMVQPSRAPQPSPYNPRLPLGSARRSFLPPAHPAKGQSINVQHTSYPVSNSHLNPSHPLRQPLLTSSHSLISKIHVDT